MDTTPMLLVFVPLLTGLICWPMRRRAALERLNLLAFAILAVLAVRVGSKVLAQGTVEAFDGFLRVDALSALVIGLIAFVAMRLAFVMVLVGYGTKAGLAPRHTWKPDAYAEAPLPSAALLGAGFINCALYGIMRFYTLATKCLGHLFHGVTKPLMFFCAGNVQQHFGTPYFRNLYELVRRAAQTIGDAP